MDTSFQAELHFIDESVSGWLQGHTGVWDQYLSETWSQFLQLAPNRVRRTFFTFSGGFCMWRVSEMESQLFVLRPPLSGLVLGWGMSGLSEHCSSVMCFYTSGHVGKRSLLPFPVSSHLPPPPLYLTPPSLLTLPLSLSPLLPVCVCLCLDSDSS